MAQHPRFESFKAAWTAAQYAQALDHVDAVIADHPRVASLHWYRANCLRKLERWADALAAAGHVLALKPDHAAALVMQVELDGADEEDVADDDDDAEPTPAQIATLERAAAERRQRHIAQLRRAIAIDPTLADAYFGLSQLVRHGSESTSNSEQADALLDCAVNLAPDRVEFRAARADLYRLRAMQSAADVPEHERVTTFGGMNYVRLELEAALQEYEHCAQLDGTHRYHVRAGTILHDLGRYDAALAAYDRALALLPPDAPQREYIVQTRARSENGGAGERDEMAKLLESLVEGGDRNQDDDMAATALLGAARAVRRGRSLNDAIAARVMESPDDLIAANVAEQILNAAYEDKPELIHVDPKTFPAPQRKYAAKQRKALEAAGVRHVADAEASGMTRTLGQRVLLGLYADEHADFNVATFALQPKWPGLWTYLRLAVTGRWKMQRMTECITYFDDGGYLITQYENISPFDYGKVVDTERMPHSTRVAALVTRHAERVAAYRAARPHASVVRATDLAGIEANWRRGQAIKREYRRSVGYATDAELRTLLGANYQRFADKVKSKLVELAVDRDDFAP